MARLRRLAVAGEAHYVIQPGHGTRPVFTDAADRVAYLEALRRAAEAQRLRVHAFALGEHEVQLLVTPTEAAGLGRTMQALGRNYVSAYNRRHGGSGTLWSGRFRAAVVEAGSWRLAALLLVDGSGSSADITSAPHRLGTERLPWLDDPVEAWRLGNTPFEREAAYRQLLQAQPAADAGTRLRAAARGGWVCGGEVFAQRIAGLLTRATRPARPARPAQPAQPTPPKPLPPPATPLASRAPPTPPDPPDLPRDVGAPTRPTTPEPVPKPWIDSDPSS